MNPTISGGVISIPAHIHTVLSLLTLARWVPSGLYATPYTWLVWPGHHLAEPMPAAGVARLLAGQRTVTTDWP